MCQGQPKSYDIGMWADINVKLHISEHKLLNMVLGLDRSIIFQFLDKKNHPTITY